MSQSNLIAGVAGAIIGYALKKDEVQPIPVVEPCDQNVFVNADGMLVDGDGNPILGDDNAPMFVCSGPSTDGPDDGTPGIVYVPKEIPENGEPIEIEGTGYLHIEWLDEEDPEIFLYEKGGLQRPEFPGIALIDGAPMNGILLGSSWTIQTELDAEAPEDYRPWFLPSALSSYNYEGKDKGPISLQASLGSLTFALKTSLPLDALANRAFLDIEALRPRASSTEHASFSDQLWLFASNPAVIALCDSQPSAPGATLTYSDLVALGRNAFLLALDEYYAVMQETGKPAMLLSSFDGEGLSQEAKALGVYNPSTSQDCGFAALLIFAQLGLAHRAALIDQLGGSFLRTIKEEVYPGESTIQYGSQLQIVTSLRALVPRLSPWSGMADDWHVYARMLTVMTWLGADVTDVDSVSSTLLEGDVPFAQFAALYGSLMDHGIAASIGDYVPRRESPTGPVVVPPLVVHNPVLGTDKPTGWALARMTYGEKPPAVVLPMPPYRPSYNPFTQVIVG